MPDEIVWDFRDDQEADFIDRPDLVEGSSILLKSDTLEGINELTSRYIDSIPGLDSAEIEVPTEEYLAENLSQSERKPYMRWVVYIRVGTENDSIFHGFENDMVIEYLEKRRKMFEEQAKGIFSGLTRGNSEDEYY